MDVALREYAPSEYPEDPATRSVRFGRYADRHLKLVQKDETRFDFVFEPTRAETATVEIKDVDVALMTPSEPEWVKGDPGLEVIALTDRQWNRQQVSFDPHGRHIAISGGDGFERENLISVELAKNCLNAGLWEILLFTRENGSKALLYHGWFTFPLGHYKRIFEKNTGISYLEHWHRLEHWINPAGTALRLDRLRKVEREFPVAAHFDPNEPVIASGEQVGKLRTVDATNVIGWKDFVLAADHIRFATFAPPGRYFVSKPWKNEYGRLAKFEGAILREIESPATSTPLHELELDFASLTGERSRFLVSGICIDKLPQVAVADYPKGLYMPMGIGVPPFFQSYDELERNPPDKSPYFSVVLDAQDRWLNHHEIAVDGPVLHRDKDAARLHVYLLSYERESLIGHFVVPIPDLMACSR